MQKEGWPPAMKGSCEYITEAAADRQNGCSSILGVGRGANNPHCKKNKLVAKQFTEPWTWKDSLDKQPKRQNMDVRCGTWNVRRLYRVGLRNDSFEGIFQI
jgi:hypothetical protein